MLTVDMAQWVGLPFPELDILKQTTEEIMQNFSKCEKQTFRNEQVIKQARTFRSLTAKRATECDKMAFYANNVIGYFEKLQSQKVSKAVLLSPLGLLLKKAQERKSSTEKLKESTKARVHLDDGFNDLSPQSKAWPTTFTPMVVLLFFLACLTSFIFLEVLPHNLWSVSTLVPVTGTIEGDISVNSTVTVDLKIMLQGSLLDSTKFEMALNPAPHDHQGVGAETPHYSYFGKTMDMSAPRMPPPVLRPVTVTINGIINAHELDSNSEIEMDLTVRVEGPPLTSQKFTIPVSLIPNYHQEHHTVENSDDSEKKWIINWFWGKSVDTRVKETIRYPPRFDGSFKKTMNMTASVIPTWGAKITTHVFVGILVSVVFPFLSTDNGSGNEDCQSDNAEKAKAELKRYIDAINVKLPVIEENTAALDNFWAQQIREINNMIQKLSIDENEEIILPQNVCENIKAQWAQEKARCESCFWDLKNICY